MVVLRENRHQLRSLNVSDVGKINQAIRDPLVSLYDRMLAQDRPCEMIISVSDPLTRKQADLFNDSNASLTLAATALGRMAFPAGSGLKDAAGFASGFSVGSVLSRRHAGDIIIALQLK